MAWVCFLLVWRTDWWRLGVTWIHLFILHLFDFITFLDSRLICKFQIWSRLLGLFKLLNIHVQVLLKSHHVVGVLEAPVWWAVCLSSSYDLDIVVHWVELRRRLLLLKRLHLAYLRIFRSFLFPHNDHFWTLIAVARIIMIFVVLEDLTDVRLLNEHTSITSLFLGWIPFDRLLWAVGLQSICTRVNACLVWLHENHKLVFNHFWIDVQWSWWILIRISVDDHIVGVSKSILMIDYSNLVGSLRALPIVLVLNDNFWFIISLVSFMANLLDLLLTSEIVVWIVRSL